MDKAESVISTYLAHVEARAQPVEPQDAPALETLVHASDALAQQLMDCVSQDRALEDVLYEVILSSMPISFSFNFLPACSLPWFPSYSPSRRTLLAFPRCILCLSASSFLSNPLNFAGMS